MTYPCPCCGHLTLTGPPGSYDLCPVCFWEDDALQLRFPDFAGGANGYSLLDAQRTFADTGTSHSSFRASVRPALDSEPLEPGWRRIRIGEDDLETWADESVRVGVGPWPSDPEALYWWRGTFWRARR